MAYDYEKERKEAVAAGYRALDSLRLARDDLSHARNWGIFDLLGGGLISSLAKRSRMRDARAHMEQARYDLLQFSRELEDVSLSSHLQLETEDFLSFADWFFDGFVVDLMMQERIRDAQDKVETAIFRVEQLLSQLE